MARLVQMTRHDGTEVWVNPLQVRAVMPSVKQGITDVYFDEARAGISIQGDVGDIAVQISVGLRPD